MCLFRYDSSTQNNATLKDKFSLGAEKILTLKVKSVLALKFIFLSVLLCINFEPKILILILDNMSQNGASETICIKAFYSDIESDF